MMKKYQLFFNGYLQQWIKPLKRKRQIIVIMRFFFPFKNRFYKFYYDGCLEKKIKLKMRANDGNSFFNGVN